MLLSLDGTFLIQILNFIVFWALLNYLYIAPTRRTIEARQRYIAEQYEDAQNLRAQAAALRAQGEAILSGARRQADASLREAVAQADAEAHCMQQETQQKVDAIVAEAHAAASAEKAQAESGALPFVEELAREMSRRALAWEKV
jgi:F-type H+-transporting ATPase subunit b